MLGRLADRMVGVAAVLVVLGSGYALVGALSAEPWVRFALRLEAASTPLDMPETVRRRLGERLAIRDAATCAWDMPRSQVTIALELVRRSMAASVAAEEREGAARNAEAAVRNAIRCSASDGNLWFLLALLEYRTSSDWTRAQPLLLTSALLSPFEGDLLLQRAQLTALALKRPDVALDLDLERDLRHAIASSRLTAASAILAGLREAGRGELADDLVAGLSPERREALVSGAPRRSTFGRSERYRHFDYNPFGETRP